MKKDKKIKVRGLFDHINHIREVQNPNYYTSLSDVEKKSFNIYMILRLLSMDVNLIDNISFISKYISYIPPEQIYSLLIQIVPKRKRYCKYIKSNITSKNENVLQCIVDYYNISFSHAEEYYNLMDDNSILELLMDFGYSKGEIDKLVA